MDSQSPNTAGNSADGVFDHLRRVIASLSAYASARFELISIEGQEAFVHYLKVIVLASVAVMFLIFGYVFLCLGIVLLAALWTGLHPGWVSLIMFAIHLIGAVTSVLVAKSLLGVRQFEMTLEEWRKDQEWLR